MKRQLMFLIAFAIVHAPLGRSQTKLEFEVASVKPNRSGTGVIGGCHGTNSKRDANDLGPAVPLGRCVITAGRLSHMIAIAYRIQISNIKGGPDWVWGVDRFDVEAKAENPSMTEEQLLLMLQNLLADRFHLRFHLETKQVSGHALVIGKNGSKLKEASGEGSGALRISGAAIYKFDSADRKNLDLNTIIGERMPMSRLALALGNLPDMGPVIDKTGLSGFYDFKLSWEPTESISSVLQEQLGLKLESQQIPVESIAIDSAEKPVN
jgi:uncharacterized protein (TIGR03435 family)